MLTSFHPPTKEIDIAFLVFVERYATDLLKWDILTFFARRPNLYVSAGQIAGHLGRSTHIVRPELGDLVLAGILNQRRVQDGTILYRLTDIPYLRNMVLKMAHQLARPNSG